MTNRHARDFEDTLDVLAGKRPATLYGRTWLRHQEDKQAGVIDLAVLKGESSVEEIAVAAGTSIVRVKRHLSHLTDDTHQGMASHRLRIKDDGKVRFDLEAVSKGDDVEKKGGVSEKWTDDEFEAAVKAYLWMLEQERDGKPYKKSDVNVTLREGPLASRTKASVEYRMQNISAVLVELSMPHVTGYVPAKNVGPDGKKKIMELLTRLNYHDPADYIPTEDPDVLEERVQKLRKKVDVFAPPKGQKTAKQTTGTSTGFVRDPVVKAWVLENAKGVCEACGNPAPFSTLVGEPFLEVHHLKQLSEKGSDTHTNAVAVCPNCHRRCHHSSDRMSFLQSIYLSVPRLVRE
ncbi:hypothetical protein GEOBRER4_n1608 [Citrifermentans bremense]|uniref:HNH nuclease domain-containing protein n=1 Tax=Citrifermentans bremense TaxID=60035 RepID=A0A6S6M540_9BACT|nr:HNH endonuclease signature motif containing protein [Citrifermentans bremense]BCG46794.1 hypothetical protein GEOBRER4_n1608 [Citrifermentans bremense]